MNETLPPSATVITFRRKRGRPKAERPSVDTGTPELMAKRQIGSTSETLDLLLERKLITPEEHRGGIHLRWLHTLRYGAPNITALDLTHVSGLSSNEDDPLWREAREQEYHDAIRLLHLHQCALLVVNLCVYNERPRFLKPDAVMTESLATEAQRTIETLKKGLDLLVKHWRMGD